MQIQSSKVRCSSIVVAAAARAAAAFLAPRVYVVDLGLLVDLLFYRAGDRRRSFELKAHLRVVGRRKYAHSQSRLDNAVKAPNARAVMLAQPPACVVLATRLAFFDRLVELHALLLAHHELVAGGRQHRGVRYW